jgi:hypothetical protein
MGSTVWQQSRVMGHQRLGIVKLPYLGGRLVSGMQYLRRLQKFGLRSCVTDCKPSREKLFRHELDD